MWEHLEETYGAVPCRVNQIVEKPTHPSTTMFPPFSAFSRLIQEQATMRNDPFLLLTADTGKMERYMKSDNRIQISARKTDVVHTSTVKECDKYDDPDEECPIHIKPHPLKKCCSFCSKPLNERKACLKDNGI